MKNKHLLLLFIFCAVIKIQAQCIGNVYIPDSSFRQALIANASINTNGDANISCAEAEAYTGTINVGGRPVYDLTGIEAFTNITYLYCAYTNLESLDLSGNVALEILRCNDSNITSLNLTNNTALKILECDDNNLDSLDISNNILLEELRCTVNNLSSLDISNNKELLILHCSDNDINSLDVSNNTALTTLNCGHNNLSSLDVSNNTELTYLTCWFNNLSGLDVSNNKELISVHCGYNNISTLDFSINSKLQFIGCSDNINLTSLNIANGNNKNIYATDLDARSNPSLNCIQIDSGLNDEQITQLAYGKDDTTSFSEDCNGATNTCTNYVNIPDVNFKAVLVTNTSINTDGDTEISCSEAEAYTGTISVTYPQNILELTGIEAFVNLTILYVQNQDITNLDLSANTKLQQLWCNSNKLISLNIPNSYVLKTLECSNNELTSLDLSGNVKLEGLYCSFNQLSNLDLSNNLELRTINCFENKLENLNISNNISLVNLFCYSNELTNLDFLNNPILETLDCSNNQLTNLDFSGNLELQRVTCSGNKLESLDVSNNIALDYIYCNDNDLTSLNVANGNNENFGQFTEFDIEYGFNATNNPNLICIQVDDALDSEENWIYKDDAASFSEDCNDATNTCTDYVYIPDVNFKAALVANTSINTDGDTEISCTEAEAFAGTISVNGLAISDLTGIEVFTNIQRLYCHNNALTSLNTSNNTALKTLYCHNNSIVSLDVSANTLLKTLFCHTNELTSLDVSNNVTLEYLNCRTNGLTSLDVSSNINLTTLNCVSNSLTSLDVSNNLILDVLFCQNNLLNTLNTSSNTVLTDLRCNSNNLSSLDISNNTALEIFYCQINSITELDTSNNLVLEYFNCNNNDLVSLNLANGNNTNIIYFNATKNSNLTCIQVDDATYSTANWTLIDNASSFNIDCNMVNLSQKSVSSNKLQTTINTVNTLIGESVSVYPNPFTESIQVNLIKEGAINKVQIYNLQGKVIVNTKATTINTSSLATGIYMLKVSTVEGEVVTKKLIKK